MRTYKGGTGMDSVVTIDYTKSMVEVLEWYDEYPCSCATVGNIADGINRSANTVRNNLKQLRAAGHAELMYEPNGEYRLLRDPRETDSDSGGLDAE